MAAAATVSPLINLTYTKSPPSGNQLFPPLPSSLLLLHPHRLRTSRDGHSRIISISQARVNASAGEDELDDIDELFSYNNGVVAEENESDDDDDAENSIDLLFRFLQSMFRKLSKRVRKASRSVLPDVIPPQLVSFGVDGVLLLASLSILKALIEVACTIGGTVFVVILLLRVIWAAISYFQSSGNNFNQSGTSYGRTQPVT